METPLDVLATMTPLPIHPVHTTGRVHWLCATSTKYPNYKVIVSSKAEEGNEAVFMMVKCNATPPVDIGVDTVIQVCHAELRNAWTKQTDGTLPEQALFPRLCSRELSVNLSAGSRKRGRSVASEIRVLTGEFLEYPVASFSVLASLAEAEVPVEGEVFVGAKMKIRDVAEVLLVDERPRRTIRVSDAGSPEGASSCNVVLYEGHTNSPHIVQGKEVCILGLSVSQRGHHAYGMAMILPWEEEEE